MGELGNGQYIHQYKPVKVMSGVKYLVPHNLENNHLQSKKMEAFGYGTPIIILRLVMVERPIKA